MVGRTIVLGRAFPCREPRPGSNKKLSDAQSAAESERSKLGEIQECLSAAEEKNAKLQAQLEQLLAEKTGLARELNGIKLQACEARAEAVQDRIDAAIDFAISRAEIEIDRQRKAVELARAELDVKMPSGKTFREVCDFNENTPLRFKRKSEWTDADRADQALYWRTFSEFSSHLEKGVGKKYDRLICAENQTLVKDTYEMAGIQRQQTNCVSAGSPVTPQLSAILWAGGEGNIWIWATYHESIPNSDGLTGAGSPLSVSVRTIFDPNQNKYIGIRGYPAEADYEINIGSKGISGFGKGDYTLEKLKSPETRLELKRSLLAHFEPSFKFEGECSAYQDEVL